MIKKFGFIFFSLILLAATPLTANAQNDSATTLDSKQIDDLVHVLEDDAERTKFLETLKALQATQTQTKKTPDTGIGADIVQRATEGLQAIGAAVSDTITAVSSPVALVADLQRQFDKKEIRAFWIGLSTSTLIALGSGLVGHFVLVSLLTGARNKVEARECISYIERIFWLGIRTLLDIAPLIGFGLSSYGAMAILDPAEQQRLIIVTLINAVVVARSLISVARLAVTPFAPSLRLVPLQDKAAGYLFVWIKRFINVLTYGYFAGEVTLLLEIPQAIPVLIAHGTALLTLSMALMLIAQNRRVIQEFRTQSTDENDASRMVDRLIRGIADVWHIPAMLYAVMVYGVWAVGQEGGFVFLLEATIGTVIILGFVRFLLIGVDRLSDRIFAVSPDLVRRLPGIEDRANRYQPVIRLVLSILIALVAFLSVLEVWGVDVTGMLTSEYGRDLLGRIIRILLITGLAIAVIEVTHLTIARYLEMQDDDGNQVARSARMKTLLPLARSAVVVVVGLVGGLTIMSELGINIGPILAGAGVLGLAVGFGAQTLVKDVITGVFILMEDSIAVGDVVKVAGHSGTVEALSVRSIRLRDISGTVHSVPFSSVDSVENLTKEFSYYLLDVGVAYRENTDDVIRVLEAIDREFQKEPTVRDDLLAPLEVMGVNALGDSSVVVRARLKTRPGQQWRIGREFNRRMKLVFDDLGIEIPFPHQTIYFGENKDGTAPPLFLARRTKDAEVSEEQESPSLDDRVRQLTKMRGSSSDAEPPNMDGEL